MALRSVRYWFDRPVPHLLLSPIEEGGELMSLRRVSLIALTAVGAILLPLVGSASAKGAGKPAPVAIPLIANLQAGPTGRSVVCPPGVPPNAVCIPASATTVTSSNSSSSSTVHIKIHEKITENIRVFERTTGVVVAVNQVSGGSKSRRGCVDPIRMGWIQNGGAFRNTRSNGAPFWTKWKKAWRICGAHQVREGKNVYWEGTKPNCGNKKIRIPIRINFVPRVRPVLEVRSLYSFERFYEKWVEKKSSGSSTTTSTTQYSCPTTYTLFESVCYIVTAGPPPPPPPPATGSGVCTALSLSKNGLNVTATAQYSVNNATFIDALFNWGDGSQTGPQSSTTASHAYVSGGSKTVSATLRFNTPGGTTSDSCSASIDVTPPKPDNRPPQVQINNGPQHVFVNGQVQICATFSDPDNDGLQVTWTASRGTVSSGRECVRYTAPATEGSDTVTVTVSDGKESRSASVSFPIKKDEF